MVKRLSVREVDHLSIACSLGTVRRILDNVCFFFRIKISKKHRCFKLTSTLKPRWWQRWSHTRPFPLTAHTWDRHSFGHILRILMTSSDSNFISQSQLKSKSFVYFFQYNGIKPLRLFLGIYLRTSRCHRSLFKKLWLSSVSQLCCNEVTFLYFY